MRLAAAALALVPPRKRHLSQLCRLKGRTEPVLGDGCPVNRTTARVRKHQTICTRRAGELPFPKLCNESRCQIDRAFRRSCLRRVVAGLRLPLPTAGSRPSDAAPNPRHSPIEIPSRRAIPIASSNCYTDDDPATPEPFPPMPPYDTSVFALDYDGNPLWRWRPREIHNADLSFGATANLFEVEIEGGVREVLGIG